MSYTTKDVYYDPQHFGLVPVYEHNFIEEPYEFDIRMVWRHAETGKLYTARDSGCSCPSPFENYTSLDSLEEIDPRLVDFRALDRKEYPTI